MCGPGGFVTDATQHSTKNEQAICAFSFGERSGMGEEFRTHPQGLEACSQH